VKLQGEFMAQRLVWMVNLIDKLLLGSIGMG